MSEKVCVSCGTPHGDLTGSLAVCCDDICSGALWDRRGPHFVDGSMQTCGQRYLAGEIHPDGSLALCALHTRLAEIEFRWRAREGHSPTGHLYPALDAEPRDPWDGVA